MQTQINLIPFTGTFDSIKLLAVTPTETKEVEIDSQQRLHMKDIRQFYVEMPSDVQRLDIQVDGECKSVQIDENTRRVIHVGICPPEAIPQSKLTAQQAMELAEAIERSGGTIIYDELDGCPECGSDNFFESSLGYSQCRDCGYDESHECAECGSSDFFESSLGYSQCHGCGNVW
jgi:ribosomal protein L37AE/L43A